MSSEIQVSYRGQQYEITSFGFAGGELQVRIDGLPAGRDGDLTVNARIQSPSDLIRLVLASEIIGRLHRSGRKTLVVPYFPYARQDRVMQPGEAFSLKAIARLINSLGFDEVVTCDPHSEVTPALVENIRTIPQVELIERHESLAELIRVLRLTLVAPDAGAAKKAHAIAQLFRLPLLTASKIRDVATGAITRTELNGVDGIEGGNVLIVDDICDGGRTFIELAKVLRQRGAVRIYLYVTHGIFSQGLGVFQGLIDGVFTTNSFLSRDVEAPHQSPTPLHVSPIHF